MGKERLLSHGQYPDISLAQARAKLNEARSILADGQDPAIEKKLAQINAETQARTTFKLIAEEYIVNMDERGLAPATMKKKRWLLLDLASPLHTRPISEITSAELLYLLKSIEKSGRRETAKKMRGAISAVFRLAVVTLRAETDPTYAIKDALIPPKVTSRAAITNEKKFGQLLRDLDEYTGWRIVVEALTFQILTMTRPGEVRGAKKQEIDLENRTWTIPPERMKMRREHIIPLSDQALKIVEDNWPTIEVRGAKKQEIDLENRTWTIPPERMKMRREHIIPLSDQALKIVEDNWPTIEGVELLFPSLISNRKWLSENAFNSSLRRMGYQKEEVTAHGFRATASTILNTRGFEPDIIEAALAHQDKNVIRRTYNRATYFDQRAKLMQGWANLIDEFRGSDA